MGKLEQIEKEIDFLIQEFRGYFLVLIAIATGEASLLYAVLSGDKPVYILFLAVIGLFVLLNILLKVKAIKQDIYVNLKKLKEV